MNNKLSLSFMFFNQIYGGNYKMFFGLFLFIFLACPGSFMFDK